MNNIGFGILCFGADYYFNGAIDKMNHIIDRGFRCYILTDNRVKFINYFSANYILDYNRQLKSYYDKMLLPKHILKHHDICILMDADLCVTDYSFLDYLKEYKFSEGISYIDILLNHKCQKQCVKDLDLFSPDWNDYRRFAEYICPDFGDLELMWEYFLVINRKGFNQAEFYKYYEKLQIAKEYCDLQVNKEVYAPGEGISIAISADLSNTPIQRDMVLYDKLKDNMLSVSRRFTPKHLWPDILNDTK